MGDVIDLDDHRPHNSGPAKCLACKREWVATAPVGAVELECPGCGCMTGTFAGLCHTAFLQPQCDCGSMLFAIDVHSPYCIRCGSRPDPVGPRPAA